MVKKWMLYDRFARFVSDLAVQCSPGYKNKTLMEASCHPPIEPSAQAKVQWPGYDQRIQKLCICMALGIYKLSLMLIIIMLLLLIIIAH